MGLKKFAVQNKGMSQDVSISKETQEFAFKNYNIRIQATDDNTLFSVTNIKGPTKKSTTDTANLISYEPGAIVGTCEAGDYLVVFIKGIDYTEPNGLNPPTKGTSVDRIIRIDKDLNIVTLVQSDALNFHLDKKINSLYYYESQKVQKVYWVDDWYSDEELAADPTLKNNFPRVINILDVPTAVQLPNIDVNALSIFPPVGNPPTITVEKLYLTSSQLPAGVIQYYISYYRYNAAETSVVQTTPVYSIDYNNRGAGPEDTGVCSFQLTISDIDPDYDYLRVYSAVRTSENTSPIVSIVGDYPINTYEQGGVTLANDITVLDGGINQENVDPSLLYFIGGSPLYARTITQKDNTAFYGNIKDASIYFSEQELETLEAALHYNLTTDTDGSGICTSKILGVTKKEVDLSPSQFGKYYTYRKEEPSYKTFKADEIYRFAIQFQNSFGAWSNPIWCGDLKMPSQAMYTSNSKRIAFINNVVTKIDSNVPQPLSTLLNTLNPQTLNILSSKGIVAYKILMADAELGNGRQIVAQGIVNPTLFNPKQRINNSPYCLPSWIARPVKNDYIPWHHFEPLNDATSDNAEIQITPNKNGEYYYQPGYPIPTNVTPSYNNYAVIISSAGFKQPPADGFILEITLAVVNARDASNIFFDNDSRIVTIVHKRWELPAFGAPAATGVKVSEFLEKYNLKTQPSTLYWDFGNVPQITFESYQTAISTLYGGGHWNPIQEALEKRYDSLSFSRCGWVGLSNIDRTDLNPGKLSYDTIFSDSQGTAINEDLAGHDYTPFCLPSELKYVYSGAIPVTGNNNQCYIAVEKLDDTYLDKNNYFIDASIVTLNSPDIDIDASIIKNAEYKFRIVGAAEIGTNYADIEVSTLTNGKLSDAVFNKNAINSYLHPDSFGPPESLKNSETPWLLSDYFYTDAKVSNHTQISDALSWSTKYSTYKIFMWNRSGSILGVDTKTTYYDNSTQDNAKLEEPFPAILENKTIINNRTNIACYYTYRADYGNVNCKYVDGGETTFTANNKSLTYFSDYDYMLEGDAPIMQKGISVANTPTSPSTCRIKFNSTPHVIFSLGTTTYNGEEYINILPFNTSANSICDLSIGKKAVGTNWGTLNIYDLDKTYNVDYVIKSCNQVYDNLFKYISPCECIDSCSSLIGELYYDIPYTSLYGGYTKSALEKLSFIPVSNIIELDDAVINTEGDTYYQMYDCLKTYPSTDENFENNVIDITSVMIESHYNIDGRYDNNRASFNIMTRPTNFNLYNLVYSQKDNLMQYSMFDTSLYSNEYPQQINWTLTKNYLGEVDTWCNPIMSNLTNVGHKLTQLLNFNNTVVALTEHSIEKINFNEKTMVATDDNSFIEVANSAKVDGTTKFQYPYGTFNQTYQITERGLYFVDDNENSIIRINIDGSCTKIGIKTMDSWMKHNIVQGTFTPSMLEDTLTISYTDPLHTIGEFPSVINVYIEPNTDFVLPSPDKVGNKPIHLEYDAIHKDLYIVCAQCWCLIYNELLELFTSFIDFQDIEKLISWKGELMALAQIPDYELEIKDVPGMSDTKYIGTRGNIYKMYSNNSYNITFGKSGKMEGNTDSDNYTPIDYSMQFRLNPAPYSDKTFTNIEFNADLGTAEWLNENTSKKDDTEVVKSKLVVVQPSMPFNKIRAWNEYQNSGTVTFKYSNLPANGQYLSSDRNLAAKFRTWRGLIPRDGEADNKFALNRMRNPWIHLELKYEQPIGKNVQYNYDKMEFHNMIVQYIE